MAQVTPRVDIAFKKIFGVEENKDLLISLINSIVSKEDEVADLELLNPYNPQNFKNDKLSILDIKAKDTTGQYYNIEMQISDEADYDKRALYYWAKLYTEQLAQSVDYSCLRKTIGIHILNFVSIPDTEKYHNVFQLEEKETGLYYFKDIELHTIELRKFEESTNTNLIDNDPVANMLSKVKTSLDAWVTFLTKHDLLTGNNLPAELELQQSAIRKALDVLNIMNFSSSEREEYEAHLKWLRTEASGIKKAEEKSFAKGLETGIEQGIEKGKKDSAKRIAKDLLVQKVSIEVISSSTGLTEEEIRKLGEE